MSQRYAHTPFPCPCDLALVPGRHTAGFSGVLPVVPPGAPSILCAQVGRRGSPPAPRPRLLRPFPSQVSAWNGRPSKNLRKRRPVSRFHRNSVRAPEKQADFTDAQHTEQGEPFHSGPAPPASSSRSRRSKFPRPRFHWFPRDPQVSKVRQVPRVLRPPNQFRAAGCRFSLDSVSHPHVVCSRVGRSLSFAGGKW